MSGPGAGRREPRRRRLSRSAEFERVYRQGRSKANRFLVLYAFPREEAPTASAAPASRVPEPGASDPSLAPGAAVPAASSGPAASSPSPPPAGPRLGLSVSRKVGGAVERNRIKRVLREGFWAEAERLPPGADYVVVARPDVRGLDECDGQAGVRSALTELMEGFAAPARSAERRREASA